MCVCVWGGGAGGCLHKYISTATWPPQTKITSSALDCICSKPFLSLLVGYCQYSGNDIRSIL